MLALLAAALWAAVALSLRCGSQDIPLGKLLAALRQRDPNDPALRILLHVRVPRTLAGGLAATGAELVLGAFYRDALGVKFWDYHGMPGSLGGLVCPVFSLCWTVLALVLVYGVQPLAEPFLAAIPPGLAPPAAILLGADGLVSCAALRRAGSTEVLKWYAAE